MEGRVIYHSWVLLKPKISTLRIESGLHQIFRFNKIYERGAISNPKNQIYKEKEKMAQ